MNKRNIARYFRVIDSSLFMVCGNLDYERVTDAIIKLANAVDEYDGDTESIWCIGEFGECCLSDLIVGAYWHFTEWHGGQWSKGYAALSALGQVFQPGMTSIESERADGSPAVFAYDALEDMAKRA